MRGVDARLDVGCQEDHGKPIFGVRFNPLEAYKENPRHLFATVGSNRATIYECGHGGSLTVLQAYVDECVSHCYLTYKCYHGCWEPNCAAESVGPD